MDSAVDSVDSALCWDTGSSDAHQEEYLAHHHHHHVQGDALVDLQHLESQHQGEVVHLDESSGLHQHEPADLNNQTDEVSAAVAFYSSITRELIN
jgi:hypothetical protein